MFTAPQLSTRQQALYHSACSSSNAFVASYCPFVFRVFSAGSPPTLHVCDNTLIHKHWFCSTSDSSRWVQIFSNMKDARKQQAQQATTTQRINTNDAIAPSLNETQELQKELMETAVFRDKPTTRTPLSADDINFRNYLKSKLPRHEATEATERLIRNAMKEKD